MKYFVKICILLTLSAAMCFALPQNRNQYRNIDQSQVFFDQRPVVDQRSSRGETYNSFLKELYRFDRNKRVRRDVASDESLPKNLAQASDYVDYIIVKNRFDPLLVPLFEDKVPIIDENNKKQVDEYNDYVKVITRFDPIVVAQLKQKELEKQRQEESRNYEIEVEQHQVVEVPKEKREVLNINTTDDLTSDDFDKPNLTDKNTETVKSYNDFISNLYRFDPVKTHEQRDRRSTFDHIERN